MQDWIDMELETSGIGDAGLDARYLIVMNDLSQKPSLDYFNWCLPGYLTNMLILLTYMRIFRKQNVSVYTMN